MSNVRREEKVLREKQRKRNEEFLNSLWKLETKVNDGILEGTHDAEKLKTFLQDFLEKKEEEKEDLILEQGINILGKGKVITAKQAAKVKGKKAPKGTPIIPSEEILRQCAKENKQGQDWRLIYCFGESLRDLRNKFGIDPKQQPCFNLVCEWYKESKEDIWATKRMESGYYLINFFGQFSDMSWSQQEVEIVKLGDNYERCHEAIFSEAILTIFMVNDERIPKDWYHCGVSETSNGNRVLVSFVSTYGLGVYEVWDGRPDPNNRVAIVRKF